ncbi:TPA: hypothetical protein ME922_001074 [Klebsiella pneumoniae]|uniref:hypothetical protein n=1 Tax=Klebsiella pneumoniae complex TaxID=3390273 RepID=UPI001CDAA639|nr:MULTISPECIES: hypothetical protein [Klebsiella]EIX9611384.1 hypothetical protein [Klebsiella pneumoniae]EJC6298657.1 hypothetical protein [Klebsiella pneumoniae]MDT9854038.1 hypothetical protein [Klebsiella pneumoniae]MDU6128398.1 hypothetical protein [Klebsiella pneumoniae]MDU7856219.1 hypothetical protein [Klebsiella pneumoniae]
MTLNKWSILGGIIGLTAALWYIRDDAYSEGLAAGRLECSKEKTQQAADALNQFIAGAKELTAQANQASTLLSQQIDARQLADEKSTEAIREALKKNAASRAGCKFDAGVMQELARAREQAATTATSGFARPADRSVSSPGISGQ